MIKKPNGFSLVKMAILCSTMMVMAATIAFFYLSALEVAEKTPHIRGARPLANAFDTLGFAQDVLPDTFLRVADRDLLDPWGDFSVIANPDGGAAAPMAPAAVFCRNEDGSISADLDGDGAIDLCCVGLSKAHLEMLSRLTSHESETGRARGWLRK